MEIDGKMIRRIRNDKGLTGKQLADMVGCQNSYLMSIERNEVRPSLDLLERIGEALGVDDRIFIKGVNLTMLPADPVIEMTIDLILKDNPHVSMRVGERDIPVPSELAPTILRLVLNNNRSS